MNSSPSAFLLAVSALVLLGSCSRTPAPPEQGRETVQWAGHTLREVRTLSALPQSIQAVLGVGNAGLAGIADRDGKYNVTDVVDSRLPMRRLLVAGVDNEAALVAIEHGGWGWGVEVTLFSDTGRSATVQQAWTLFESPRTLRALVDALHLKPRSTSVPRE